MITQVKKNDKVKRRNFLSFLCGCFKAQPEPLQTIASSRPVNINYEALLPPLSVRSIQKKTLVLDLDETLVHSSFKSIQNPDFIIPVEFEEQIHQVYVLKRPGVDYFLTKMAEFYEIIVFTASLSKYADPLLDLLDTSKIVNGRLFREACVYHKGNYVKDLARLGRDLKSTIIIDNSPASYMFHPENAIPVESWFDDNNDTELMDIIPFMEFISRVDDVRVEILKAQRT